MPTRGCRRAAGGRAVVGWAASVSLSRPLNSHEQNGRGREVGRQLLQHQQHQHQHGPQHAAGRQGGRRQARESRGLESRRGASVLCTLTLALALGVAQTLLCSAGVSAFTLSTAPSSGAGRAFIDDSGGSSCNPSTTTPNSSCRSSRGPAFHHHHHHHHHHRHHPPSSLSVLPPHSSSTASGSAPPRSPVGTPWPLTRARVLDISSSSSRSSSSSSSSSARSNSGSGGETSTSLKSALAPVVEGVSLTDASEAMSSSSASGTRSSAQQEIKVGVLLLNLGGPETAEDVEGFLYNLFADPDIIRLPPILSVIQAPLARFLSSRRAPKSRAAYESIGGGSPIVRYTRAQGKGLEDRLREKGLTGAKAYVAMRYWHPFTEQALSEMKKDDINTLVVLPLYPQFSISTSGSSLRLLREIFLKDAGQWGPQNVRHTVIPAWYNRPGYVRAVSALISKELDSYSAEQRKEGLHVLFSAHGVPQSYIDVGDPYQKQIEDCVEMVRKEYEAVHGSEVTTHLSYQSRVGPIEWIKPYTEDVIVDLGEKGVKNLVVVPISFVSEHIETLEEIDMEYKELAEENGIIAWRRVPALNTDPTFLDDLADLCVEALGEPSISISEACTQNNVDLESDDLGSGLNKAESRNQLLSGIAVGSLLLDVLFGKGVAHLVGVI